MDTQDVEDIFDTVLGERKTLSFYKRNINDNSLVFIAQCSCYVKINNSNEFIYTKTLEEGRPNLSIFIKNCDRDLSSSFFEYKNHKWIVNKARDNELNTKTIFKRFIATFAE